MYLVHKSSQIKIKCQKQHRPLLIFSIESYYLAHIIPFVHKLFFFIFSIVFIFHSLSLTFNNNLKIADNSKKKKFQFKIYRSYLRLDFLFQNYNEARYKFIDTKEFVCRVFFGFSEYHEMK